MTDVRRATSVAARSNAGFRGHGACWRGAAEVPVWWWMMFAMAVEVPYDGIDQDGDGRDRVDVDGDGYAGVLAFGPDCADRDPSVHPGAPDLRGDLVDRDCGGSDGPDRRWLTRACARRR